MTIDSQEFRHVLGRFATGVTIITTHHNGKPLGFTANAFCSVSLDPPLVLVCIDNAASSLNAVKESGIFAVNILAEDQETIARWFAKSGPQKNEHFGEIAHHSGETGAPLFDGALAWVECRITATYPGGDHLIVVGEVVTLGARAGSPLLFANAHYATLPVMETATAVPLPIANGNGHSKSKTQQSS